MSQNDPKFGVQNNTLIKANKESVGKTELEAKTPPEKYEFQKSIEAKTTPQAKIPPAKSQFTALMDLEIARKRRLANDLEQANLDLKKGICRWVKWVVSIYLSVIGSVVVGIALYNKYLSDAVLIALLTTTTVNILGLPLMIILSLFPNKKKLQE